MTEGTIGDFWTKVDPRHLGILLGCSHGGTLFPHNFPTSLPLRTLYHISMYCFKCYFCLLADRGYFPDAKKRLIEQAYEQAEAAGIVELNEDEAGPYATR